MILMKKQEVDVGMEREAEVALNVREVNALFVSTFFPDEQDIGQKFQHNN
jgi:hypothetical protein